MTEEKFRFPFSTYDQLAKIVMAYGAANGPVSPSDVAKTININSSTVSSNNAFLLSVGVLEGTKQRTLTAKGRELAHALAFEQHEDAERIWEEIVAPNDFVQKVLAAVRIRRGMDRSALQSHVAYSAGLPKNESNLRGANTIIEIMKLAGLLIEEDGKFIITNGRHVLPNDSHQEADPLEKVPAQQQPIQNPTSSIYGLIPNSQVPISIQIQVQCSVDDLSHLGPMLKSLIAELSDTTVETESISSNSFTGSEESDTTIRVED